LQKVGWFQINLDLESRMSIDGNAVCAGDERQIRGKAGFLSACQPEN
jgi:hypothetical protein